MAREHWILFGMFVATLLVALSTLVAPSMAALVQHRLAQKSLGLEKPPSVMERVGRWLKRPVFDFLPLIPITLASYMLYGELSSLEPLTRASAFVICLYTSTIVGNIILILVGRIINKILDIQLSAADLFQRHLDATHLMVKKINLLAYVDGNETTNVNKTSTKRKGKTSGLKPNNDQPTKKD